MNAPENKMHPLMIVAATSVTVASLAAIASFTGLLPGKSAAPAESTAAPLTAAVPATAAVVAPVAAPTTPEAPAAKAVEKPPVTHKVSKPAPEKHVAKSTQTGDYRQPGDYTGSQQGSAYPAAGMPPAVSSRPTPPICNECGTIESIHEVKVKADGTGLGVIAGGVLGGLLGNQMGKGTGKTLATVAAAAGGAYAGNQVEKNVRAESQTEITVRFDDGSVRSFNQQDTSRWRQGDRIRMSNGNLLPI